jgi:glucokinase
MQMKYVFGVDIGGTTVKLGCFRDAGELMDKWEIPTNTKENGVHILEDVADSILTYMRTQNMEHSQVSGVGVGVPGPVLADGTVNKCINLGWGVFRVSETLEALLSLPVKVGNDATVATLGEMWQGGGQGFANVVMLTLGTGVGGGVVIDGNIVYGTTGAAGEVGHMCVNPEELTQCNCGNAGCLEQYASATGIVNMARKVLDTTQQPSALRKLEGDKQTITAKDIFDCARNQDALAEALVLKYNNYLGLACSYIGAVVNPEVFVIGGGVSKAGDILLKGVAEAYDRYVFHACRNAQFRLATLGNDAGIYGAAKMILSASTQ